MAPPSFVGTPSTAENISGGGTVATPSGATLGETLFAFIKGRIGATGDTAVTEDLGLSGFTTIGVSTETGGQNEVAMAIKVVDATDVAGTTYNPTSTGANTPLQTYVWISRIDAEVELDQFDGDADENSTNWPIPTITTGAADTLAIVGMGPCSTDQEPPPAPWTDAGGVTNHIRVGYQEIAASGSSVGGESWSSLSFNNGYKGLIVSLKPVAGGGGPVTGDGSTSMSLTTSATGTRIVSGDGSTDMAMSLSATGRKTARGAGSTTMALTTSATGGGAMTGSGASSMALSTSASGIRIVKGSGASALAFASSATGRKTARTSGISAMALSLAASGVRTVRGSGSTSMGLTTSASTGSPFSYPNPGTTTLVGSGDDPQTVIDAASARDVLVFAAHDFTDDAVVLTIDKPLHIRGQGVGTTKLPRVKTTTAVAEVWLGGLTIERTTPVDSNGYVGFQSDGGALTDSYFYDLEITGHGLTIGFELNRRWRNSGVILDNIEVHEVENRAFWLNCDNLTTWGLHAHDLYRTVDQSFFDVDAVNFAGSNQVHRGFWFHDINEADSISVESAGRANPAGPLGSASTPHPDGFQSYRTLLADASVWLTDNILIQDGTIDLRNGGRQAIILESNSSAGAHIVTNVTVRGCYLAGEDAQVVNVKGVDGLILDGCDLWMPADSSTTFRGVRFTSGSGGGATTNPNCELTNNRYYPSDGQPFYAGTVPGDLVDTGNTSPGTAPADLTPWDTPTLITRPAPTTGSGSTVMSLTTSATGNVDGRASGATVMSLTTSATGQRIVSGSGSTAISLTTSATGEVGGRASGATVMSLATSATGQRIVTGSGSTAISLTTSATGRKTARGSGASSMALSTSATGTVLGSASGATVMSLSTSATGKRITRASGSTTMALTTTASGTVVGGASGATSMVLTSSATGRKLARAVGATNMSLSTTATADLGLLVARVTEVLVEGAPVYIVELVPVTNELADDTDEIVIDHWSDAGVTIDLSTSTATVV